MSSTKKKLRKILWTLHEIFSPLGYVVWANHRIQEHQEAIEELTKRGDKKE